jgi:GGDEF domain-containing protein
VIAEGSGRAEGVALGERLAAAVREGGFWRGAPLGVSVGVAVLGEDGDDASELIAAAEEARFAAEAAGLAVGGSDGVGGGG